MADIKAWECVDADSGTDLAREIRSYYIPDFSNWADADEFEIQLAKVIKALQAGSSGGKRGARAGPVITNDVFSSIVLPGEEVANRLTNIALQEAGLDESAVKRRRLLVNTEEGYHGGDLYFEYDPSVSFIELSGGRRLVLRNDQVRRIALELAVGSAINSQPIRAKIEMKRGCTYEGCKPLPLRKFTVEFIYARNFESLPVDQRIDYLMLLLFEARCDFEYIWGSDCWRQFMHALAAPEISGECCD
jgi:hypothetical protein